MQVGQGVSRLSPFGAARHWRRGGTDQAQPSRPAAPATGGRQDAPVAQAVRPLNLSLTSAEELERHLTGLFGRRGYTVWPMPSRGEVAPALLICRADQGVVVQVKRWNGALGPEVVTAVVAAVHHHAATLARLGCSQLGGMVISTCQFTEQAHALAAASGVLLWDRQELETQLQADLAALPPSQMRQASRLGHPLHP